MAMCPDVEACAICGGIFTEQNLSTYTDLYGAKLRGNVSSHILSHTFVLHIRFS